MNAAKALDEKRLLEERDRLISDSNKTTRQLAELREMLKVAYSQEGRAGQDNGSGRIEADIDKTKRHLAKLSLGLAACERDIVLAQEAMHRQQVDDLKRRLADLQRKAAQQADDLEHGFMVVDKALAEAVATWNEGRVILGKLAELSNPDRNTHRGMIGSLAAFQGAWRDPAQAVEMRWRMVYRNGDGLLPNGRFQTMREAFFGARDPAAEQVIKRA